MKTKEKFKYLNMVISELKCECVLNNEYNLQYQNNNFSFIEAYAIRILNNYNIMKT